MRLMRSRPVPGPFDGQNSEYTARTSRISGIEAGARHRPVLPYESISPTSP